MTEVTYISEVECEVLVAKGMFDSKVVQVVDTDEKRHVLRVPDLNEDGGKNYLPVGLVAVDKINKRALIEFPSEADSGTKRAWIALSKFHQI
ncbi:MAG: hypothetical protein LC104_06730 [Bacteroidales bacterium]|nr:hypothetical protein [Bacteroidales bacterium]